MNPPIIVAHRGLHDHHTENTLAAFRAAWDAGITWCECDIRGSRDGHPVIIHDDMLDRTTAAKGFVHEHDVAGLRAFNVPSMQEMLDLMPQHACMLVEIKPNVADEVVNLAMDLCDPVRCVVQSFDADILWLAHTRRADIPLEYLVDEANQPLPEGSWRAINAQFKTLSPDTIARIRQRGLRVGAWTVNDDADIRRILSLDLDTIISDRPLRVRDIAREMGKL